MSQSVALLADCALRLSNDGDKVNICIEVFVSNFFLCTIYAYLSRISLNMSVNILV